jgi:tRNA(fMet)-specific endonuclease VapC
VSHVLDTNVLAGLMRGDEHFVARLERLSRRAVFVPEPAWAEIAYGLARLPPSARRTRLEARAELLREELLTSAWTRHVSDAFGALKSSLEAQGRRLDDLDVAIAAHAVAAGAALVTSNVRHFGRIEGLAVEDWAR